MNESTFWTIKYKNGSVFSKASYMNGVGFEILALTLDLDESRYEVNIFLALPGRF